MGEPVPISLGLRSNPARTEKAGSARLINCFAEETEEDGKSTWTIYGTAGLANFGTALEGGGIRDMIVVGETLYAAAGRNLHAVSLAGVSQLIGGMPTDGRLEMDSNRKVPPQIGVVSGGLYSVIDTLANSTTAIFDPDLPAPVSIAVLDGYGILPNAGGTYMLTGLDELTTVDGLDEGTCESYSDGLVRVATLEREAVFFGPRSIEWQINDGSPDFPFSRVHALELGCLAPDSVAKVDTKNRKTLIWVAPDHTVRAMNGYSGEVISTDEIEQLIKSLHNDGEIDTLKGFGWADAGRFFYALTCDRFSKIWDAKTGNWHDRKSYGLNRWRISKVVQFGSKLIAGDFENGQLYEMNDNYYDEAGEHLVAEIHTPPVHAFPYRLSFNGLFLDVAKGVGLNSPSVHAASPKVMISYSDDGGVTYGAERERQLGALAQNMKRVQPVLRMGSCGQTGRVFKFRISSPVQRVVIQASVDFDRMDA